MYGMPQPSAYGQYGFGGYPGFQGTGGAGTTWTTPGMPQANPGTGGLGNGTQPGTTDLNISGQPVQGQWPTATGSYYPGSSYYGGGGFFSFVPCVSELISDRTIPRWPTRTPRQPHEPKLIRVSR